MARDKQPQTVAAGLDVLSTLTPAVEEKLNVLHRG